MSKQTWSGMFVAGVFALAAVVAAQSPAPQGPPTASPPTTQAPPSPEPSAAPQAPAASTPQASDENKVSVTGCLRQAPASPTGTAGSTTAAPSTTDAAGKADAANAEAKFVLANAVPSSSNAPAAAAHETAPKTYQLIANEAALTPHLGKKLELTGTIEGQESSATATAQAGGAASASASIQPKLRVQSGKVVAGDCMP